MVGCSKRGKRRNQTRCISRRPSSILKRKITIENRIYLFEGLKKLY